MNKRLGAWVALLAATMASVAWADGGEYRAPLRYGPNLRHQFLADAPLYWGTWVPRSEARLDFSWIEPLGASPYGGLLPDSARYLRLQGATAISPYYASFQTALGFALFKANPRVELRLQYTNQLYAGSNVEMAMGSSDKSIAETWNADYIYDQFYENSYTDQMQSFGFSADFSYYAEALELLGSLRYTLLDVSADFDGKSYDYARSLPVYSRDFVFEASLFAGYAWSEHLDWTADVSYTTTGYLRDAASGSYSREPLGYVKALLGPSWNWNEGRSRLSLSAGGWHRTKLSAYDGPVIEQALVQALYTYQWNLAFAR